uniref:Growth arrest and DNA damage inducible beta n=1 Tax=Anas zonorhyncha TaxID=75864 RepID=A0A8B9ZY14_9AVES
MTLEELVPCDSSKMQAVSEAVERVLVAAQRQDRLTVGVYESAKLMNVDPDSVVLCVLATDEEDEGDIALQIHFTLIQAFCCDNDIHILRVSGMQRLASLLGDPEPGAEPRDLHCLLVTNPHTDAWKSQGLAEVASYCAESRDRNQETEEKQAAVQPNQPKHPPILHFFFFKPERREGSSPAAPVGAGRASGAGGGRAPEPCRGVVRGHGAVPRSPGRRTRAFFWFSFFIFLASVTRGMEDCGWRDGFADGLYFLLFFPRGCRWCWDRACSTTGSLCTSEPLGEPLLQICYRVYSCTE